MILFPLIMQKHNFVFWGIYTILSLMVIIMKLLFSGNKAYRLSLKKKTTTREPAQTNSKAPSIFCAMSVMSSDEKITNMKIIKLLKAMSCFYDFYKRSKVMHLFKQTKSASLYTD